MRVAKSSYCGVLTRPFEQAGRFYLGVTNMVFASLGDAQPSLISELAMWPFFAEEAGAGSALDAAMPKSQPEWLLTGICYPAGGVASGASAVRARVGATEKRLAVFGDRAWVDGRPTQPQPFDRMPLVWERAFGGEGDANNPLGIGMRPAKTDDRNAPKAGVHRLPNIEYLDRLIATPDQRVAPASFLPLDQTWPQRARRAGTYDDAWLKTRYPGMPADFDWRFFNIAPEDQWLAEGMNGDEAYEFENLHPSRRVLSGNLPGVVTRTFLNRIAGASERFEEVPMRLTTAWFFPHAERVILIFHGMAEVSEDDACDVLNVLAGIDRPGALKPLSHYRQVLDKRRDHQQASVEALNEQDLLPAGLVLDDGGIAAATAQLQPRNRSMRNARRGMSRQIALARAEVAGYGLDPDVHGPLVPEPEEPMPGLSEIPAYLKKIEAKMKADQAKAMAESEERDRQSAALFKDLGMDFQTILDERKQTPVGPPKFSAKAELADLTRIRDGFEPGDASYKDVDVYLQDPAFRAMLRNAETGGRDGYRKIAQHQSPAPRMVGDIARRLRERVQAHHAAGKSFANVNLTGADLSGLDLRGVDFSSAFLESANLDGANLQGCAMDNAVLVRASLKGTQLDGASLTGANLSLAVAVGASFDKAAMARATLEKTQLHSCTLRGVGMDGILLLETVLDKVDISGAKAGQTHFLKLNLHGVVAVNVEFIRCTFLECDMGEADFSGARLDGTGFVSVRAAGARFRHALMSKCCFVESCNLRGADFSHADASSASFRSADLAEADFRLARAHGADFSLAQLRAANFYQADMPGARFVRSNLDQSVLASANLMGAVFQNASAMGSDFRFANLFRADIARIRIDAATRFDGAHVKRVRTLPKWTGARAPSEAQEVAP
jgi:uncharacterized protein YjbI with pentapeptide repeats